MALAATVVISRTTPSLISAHLSRMLTRWDDVHWQVYVVRTSTLYILKQLLSLEGSANERYLQQHFDHLTTNCTE